MKDNDSLHMIIRPDEMEMCISGLLGDPHQFLGMHPLADLPGSVVRAWIPQAIEVLFISSDYSMKYKMVMVDKRGFFELHLPHVDGPFKYFLKSKFKSGENESIDPYAFFTSVKAQELQSFSEGHDRRPFTKLGAIPCVHQDIKGVSFVVWAPSAKSVHLVGDFNHWNPHSLPMRSLGQVGCREIFVPFAKIGDKYKFRVLGADGVLREKVDPFGWAFEQPPGNASIVCSRDRPSFKDKGEGTCPRSKPLSVYEMHLGSWKFHPQANRPLTYVELSEELPRYLVDHGFSHVEFLPLSEYPYGASWGYQVTGYYAPTSRYGNPEEFEQLVKALQHAGIEVIMDWVPAHFPSDEFALARFDGTCLFEHQDPRQGEHAEWGTLCYNYGRPEVCSFLIGSAIAWLDRFGINGFRVDAVASMLYLDYGRQDGQWIPNQDGGNYNLEAIKFLKEFNHAIHEEYPNAISIAEESTSFPQITQPPYLGGLGFDFKWNMGWMHDAINYFSTTPNDRSVSHDYLTFGAMYQFSENFVQAFSHDEVVHGKGSLVNKMNLLREDDRISNLRSLLTLQWTWPGKKTIFMGCEFAQWKEWDFDTALDWDLLNSPMHDGVRKLITDLNHLYKIHPTWAKYDHQSDKFKWIDCNDMEGQSLSFLKFGDTEKDTLLVACNFSDQLRHRDWGCPHPGSWRVILDTDSPDYSGDGASGGTEFCSFDESRDDFPFGLSFSVNRWSVRILSMID